MSPEEELEAFRLELKEKARQDIRTARKAATKFGVVAVAVLTAMVYAFFQQTMAIKERDFAEVALIRANERIATTAGKLTQCKTHIEQVSLSLEKCKGK